MEASDLEFRVGTAFYGSYASLTASQVGAEKPLLQGSDAIIISGTGSGKTSAVLAPLIQRHLLNSRSNVEAGIVYVVPTKALGNDVVRRIGPPLEALQISVGLRHGDAPRAASAHQSEVVVTTPESLDVLVSANPSFLNNVRAVVIDEAHILYNTQRGLQLGILIRRLEARSGSHIQVAGLSATIASATHLWKFFRPQVSESDLAIIKGDGGRPIEAVVRVEHAEGDLASVIDRIGQREHCKVLVFVNSRRVADRLAEEMLISPSFSGGVFVHHSSIGGEQRERAEREFSARARAVCVATSTLELGIDIGDVDLVVLYGLTGGWESFLQRIGRGNRRAGSAKVLCICPHDDAQQWMTALTFLGTLRAARSGGGDPVSAMALHGAVAQQILSMLRERKGGYIRLAEIAEVVSTWPHLSRRIIDEIVEELVEGGLCVRHGFKNRIGAGDRLHELEGLRLLWGNFPARSQQVPILANGKEIGAVPSSNLTRLSPGLRIRFAGRIWRTTNIQASRIDVVPDRGRGSDIEIRYLGKGIGVDPDILETTRLMLFCSGWDLEELAKGDVGELAEKWNKLSWILTDAELPFARDNEGYRYLTFAGRLVNDVICRDEKLDGYSVDDLCIWSPRPINFQSISNNIELLGHHAEESLTKAGELTIFQSMLPARLILSDLLESWHRNPCYGRVLKRLASAEPAEIDSDVFRSLLA